MKLIETTSPLYLRRLVRAINAARAAYAGRPHRSKQPQPAPQRPSILLPGG